MLGKTHFSSLNSYDLVVLLHLVYSGCFLELTSILSPATFSSKGPQVSTVSQDHPTFEPLGLNVSGHCPYYLSPAFVSSIYFPVLSSNLKKYLFTKTIHIHYTKLKNLIDKKKILKFYYLHQHH